MSTQVKAAVRSFATTFISVFLTLIPVAAVVEGDFQWLGTAAVASLTAAVRTLLAALDPGQPLYGTGSDA
jgi:heme/copper-type cytochrome/quinol oxidase subunit 4